MKWYRETTQWSNGMQNGVYLMNESRSKAFAYRSPVTQDIRVFSKPMGIDIRGRQFVINQEQWSVNIEEPRATGTVTEVLGSRGDVYRVTENLGQWSCTCSGFRFRGSCKHITQVRTMKS